MAADFLWFVKCSSCYESLLCLQEVIEEPSQGRAEEVESEGRKPDGGQSADARSG